MPVLTNRRYGTAKKNATSGNYGGGKSTTLVSGGTRTSSPATTKTTLGGIDPGVGGTPWWESNAKKNAQIQRDWNSKNASAYKQYEQSIASLKAQMNGGWTDGALQKRINQIEKQKAALGSPGLLNTNASPTDIANWENQKRYGQVVEGWNDMAQRAQQELAERSDQAVKDAESTFEAQTTSNRQDLIDRGLAASTVGAGMDAMYGRQKMAAINDAKDRQTAQYLDTMTGLYDRLYGVVERKNDIAPDAGLMAQVAAQKGQGLTGWTPYDGYGGMPSVGMNPAFFNNAAAAQQQQQQAALADAQWQRALEWRRAGAGK